MITQLYMAAVLLLISDIIRDIALPIYRIMIGDSGINLGLFARDLLFSFLDLYVGMLLLALFEHLAQK